jgi:hypothetical protein
MTMLKCTDQGYNAMCCTSQLLRFTVAIVFQNFRLSKYWWGGACCKLDDTRTLLGPSSLSDTCPSTARTRILHEDACPQPDNFDDAHVVCGPQGTKRTRAIVPAVVPHLPGARGEACESLSTSELLDKLCETGDSATRQTIHEHPSFQKDTFLFGVTSAAAKEVCHLSSDILLHAPSVWVAISL